METYKENQAKRGKKDGNQINVTIRILKDFAGDRVMMDQIDKTFCQNYLDYLQTEYRPKGKRVSNFTLHTYYRILNGALNAAVRADIIKSNPFTKINNSDKIRLPEKTLVYDH
ncbi:phage integrase SAM-like domain-containing protein [Bacteroides hominis]|uniref:phage integrase SAM-like domain-containing protein n=1 Tax=Bacteroides hominis TaxID=2763023 RepID=UPI003D6CB4EA